MKIFVTVLSLLCIAGYLYVYQADFRQLDIVYPEMLFVCALAILTQFGCNAYLNYLMIRRLGTPISFWDSFFLGIVTTASNLLLPMRGGLAARALFLKRVYRFSYANFATSVFGYYVLTLFVASLIGFFAAVSCYLLYETDAAVVPVLFGSAGCFVVSLVLLLLPKTPHFSHAFLNKVTQVIDSWHVLRSDRQVLLRLTGVTLVDLLCTGGMIYGGFSALGVKVTGLGVVTMCSLGSISSLVSITPGSIGIYEAVVAFTGEALKVDAVGSVAQSLINRLVLVLFLLLLVPVSSFYLTRRATELGNLK